MSSIVIGCIEKQIYNDWSSSVFKPGNYCLNLESQTTQLIATNNYTRKHAIVYTLCLFAFWSFESYLKLTYNMTNNLYTFVHVDFIIYKLCAMWLPPLYEYAWNTNAIKNWIEYFLYYSSLYWKFWKLVTSTYSTLQYYIRWGWTVVNDSQHVEYIELP